MEHSKKRIVLITGSNQGVGLGIAERLLKEGKWRVIMTSRIHQNGKMAIKQLKEKHKQISDFDIELLQLDLLKEKSFKRFMKKLKSLHPNGIDVLINNAGAAMNGDPCSKLVKVTLGTNYYGTKKLTELFLQEKMIKRNGKIIVISSSAGRLNQLELRNPEIFTKLSNYKEAAEEFKIEDLTKIADISSNELVNHETSSKWAGNVYGLSKLYLSIWSFLLGKSKEILDHGIQVYSCCPGFVKTNLTKGLNARLTIQQGSLTPCFLVNLPFQIDFKKQGEFFYEREIAKF